MSKSCTGITEEISISAKLQPIMIFDRKQGHWSLVKSSKKEFSFCFCHSMLCIGFDNLHTGPTTLCVLRGCRARGTCDVGDFMEI